MSRIIGGNHFFIDNEYSVLAMDKLLEGIEL